MLNYSTYVLVWEEGKYIYLETARYFSDSLSDQT